MMIQKREREREREREMLLYVRSFCQTSALVVTVAAFLSVVTWSGSSLRSLLFSAWGDVTLLLCEGMPLCT